MLSKLLITIAKKHKDQMAAHLRTLDLYVGQDIFLMTLEKHGEISQSELKERLGVEYATIHKIAKRLQKRRLIVKTKDPADNRVSVIRLSDKGKRVTEHIHRYWNQLENDFFEPLDESEQSQLHGLLQKLIS